MTTTQSQEFQFFVLNTKASWEKGQHNGTEISDAGLILESEKQLLQEKRLGEELFGQEIDLAAGDCDLLYLADANTKQISIYDAQQGQPYPVYLEWIYPIPKEFSLLRFGNVPIKFWTILLALDFLAAILFLPKSFCKPTNIAYSRSTVYIVDEIVNTTKTMLYAFGRNSWKYRGEANLGEHKIIDMIADRSGSAYVLFGDGDTLIKKYHIANDRLQELDTIARNNIQNIQEPTAIALQENDKQKILYVLGSNNGRKKIFSFNLDSDSIDDIELNGINQPRGLAVDGLGNLYIGDGASREENASEESRFIRRFSAERKMLEPVLGYRGSVKKLTINPNGNRLYILDQEKQEVIILRLEEQFLGGTLCDSSEQNNQASNDCSSPSQVSPTASYCNPPRGVYYSQAFDSTQAQMRWHKLILEREIPENTRIEISYVTSERREQIDAQIKAARSGNDSIDWSTPLIINTTDKLLINLTDALLINQKDNNSIESPSGRYLWLKIELIGTQEKSPIIKSIKVYFPRLSYLRYLPATYQEDPPSRDFLERFLSLFETSLLGIEWQIDRIARYFDADSTEGSGDFLRWLANWLAIAAENNWTDLQLRQLVKAAPKLYRKRGTKAGLELLVQIFTGDRPIILEYPGITSLERERTKIFNQLCDDDDVCDENRFFCFCVLLSPYQIKTEEQQQIIYRLIDAEKPAHTKALIYTFPYSSSLDNQSYLGVNAYLVQDRLPRLSENANLFGNTLLIDADSI